MRSKLLKQRVYAPVFSLFTILAAFTPQQSLAQGVWDSVVAPCPVTSGGGMLLLSDGTVMAKTTAGGTDGVGNTYYKLTPDIHGSYINGKWSKLAPMINTRLYYSSQVLTDGRVYVAGGEYGTGGSSGETYNPLTNKWTANPAPGGDLSDANSEILPDGRVLQAVVGGTTQTLIYNPATNTYSPGPSTHGGFDESMWVKLPDNSILFVDINSKKSERYIPASNSWVVDANVPDSLYDPYGEESGAGFLLPDGRAFYMGATPHTAFYTPSGTSSPGTWTAGPDIPKQKGAPDAAAAMMVNGNILCTFSPRPTSANHFPTPSSYYIFNYRTNAFSVIPAPAGGYISNSSSYISNMLDLPDGTVLFCFQGSSQYYIFKPTGKPLAAGKPAISQVTENPGDTTYTLTGTLFNGISEGAAYGDDWQMESNYPIVRLTSGANVYYARTYNWNRTGVMTGTLADTTQFKLPAALPAGTYSLAVIANGISSAAVSFAYTPKNNFITHENEMASSEFASASNQIKIYPNPAQSQTTIQFTLINPSHVILKVFDMNGREVKTLVDNNSSEGQHSVQLNTGDLPAGIYIVTMIAGNEMKSEKLVVR